MPSRVKKIDCSRLYASGFDVRDVSIIEPGRIVTQITPLILPDTAQELAALRIGQGGDAVPLMIQGQTFNLDGIDQKGGLYLTASYDITVGAAAGVIWFFLSMQE